MKLSKYMKEQLLKSILRDMPPLIDYKEQAQAVVWKDSHNQLPEALKEAISKDADVKSYLRVDSHSIADCGCMYLRSYDHYTQTADAAKEVKRIHLLLEEQEEKRREIKNNLWALIDNCNTAEQLAKNYPEFSGYLPKPEQPTRNLPAVELINEMSRIGWVNKNKSEVMT